MSAPTWWTAADQAELDALVWELVNRVPEHEARCLRCKVRAASGIHCPAVSEAIEAVLDWRRGRRLLSRATHLRRKEAA